MVVLGEAATQPVRWGVDLTFTYGPASAWVTRYFTDGYFSTALPFLMAVALINGLTLVLLAQHAVAARRFGTLFFLAAVSAEITALAAELALDQDSFYFTLALELLLLDLTREPGKRATIVIVLTGAALLGASALAKTSFGIVAFGVFALADARAVWAYRRPPIITPVLLLSALVDFLGHGQRLSDLPTYLDLQGQVATGYGEAMYLVPNRLEFALFTCAAAALTVVAGIYGPPRRGGRVAATLGTAFVLAIGIKAGFIRADTHTQIAWSLLGLAGLAVAIGLVLRRSPIKAMLLGLSSLFVLWIIGPLFLLVATDRSPKFSAVSDLYQGMSVDLAVELEAWVRFLGSPSRFIIAAHAAKFESWHQIRIAQPLPKLDGTVDILPSEQSAVLAAGLGYDPRPSFQEYSTYTERLVTANRAFYGGDRAPNWVIFGLGGLDDRYPNSTEGALWPDLLQRYEPQRRIGPWVVLRRRPVPLPDVLGPPSQLAATLDRRVVLTTSGPVFARVTVTKTLLGRLASLVFRPPALSMRVALAGGDEQSYRFIPAIAASGFLLSPLISDAADFASLAFGAGRDAGGAEVTALTVGGSPWSHFFYDPAISIELRPLTVPDVPPSAQASEFAENIARQLPWRRLARSIGGRLDGDRLSAPAPTPLSIPVAGARHLRLNFGIEEGAWIEGRTEGVCFAIKVAPDAAAPLWRRCLNPKSVPADRGPQAAEVALPSGLVAVTAETACFKSCDWGWSYWSDISPSE